MKGIKFEKLTKEERIFCDNMAFRCNGSFLPGVKLTLAKIVQKPWMCVIIKKGKAQGIGFSKQCQYAPDKDEWNENIGKNIALSRAVRDMLGK